MCAWLGAFALCGTTSLAWASPICVSNPDGVDGIDVSGLQLELAIETRKRDRGGTAPTVFGDESCPDRRRAVWIRVDKAGRYVVEQPGGLVTEGRWEGVEVVDRNATIAGAVAESRSSQRGSRADLRLIDPDAEVEVPAWILAEQDAVRTDDNPGLGLPARGYVFVDGAYIYDDANGNHLAGIGLEAGAAFFDEQLAAGAAVQWTSGLDVQSGADVDLGLQLVDLVATLRGGPRLGPVWLRAGTWAGWQWRVFDATSPLRFDTLNQTTGAFVYGGEIEVLWDPVEPLRIAVTGRVKGYAGGTTLNFGGEPVWDAPEFEFGGALRVGVVY